MQDVSHLCLWYVQFMGVVEETGTDVKKVQKGQRYVCCFDIACGDCFYCKHQLFSCCMRSNPSNMTCGLYGHKLGGFYGESWCRRSLPLMPLIKLGHDSASAYASDSLSRDEVLQGLSRNNHCYLAFIVGLHMLSSQSSACTIATVAKTDTCYACSI